MLTAAAISSKVTTGLTSLVLNFYHLGACNFSSLTGLFDKSYHLDMLGYYSEQGWNAFYKLIGSERRIYLFPSSTKLLVPTKNRPGDEYNKEATLLQVTEKVQELIKGYLPTFMEIHPEESSTVEDGVCQGMVQIFIRQYYQACGQDLSFKEAAIKAAEPFREGATFSACFMQHLHEIVEVNDNDFDLTFPKDQHTDSKRVTLKCAAKSYSGHLMLGAKTTVCKYDFSNVKDLGALEDGAYDITIGWTIRTEHDGGQTWDFLSGRGHANALLVHDKSFLIFDPTMGLFNHVDPGRFFDVRRKYDNGILLCTSVKY